MPRLRWMFIAALGIFILAITSTVYCIEFQKLVKLKTAVTDSSVRLMEKERVVMEHREKVAFYKTDEGMAHLAREQYNLAFPGEQVYIVRRDSSTSAMEVIKP